mgnify:FL=1
MANHPTTVSSLLDCSQVHPNWRNSLSRALDHVETGYLTSLLDDDQWLPGNNNLFAAFRDDPQNCRYLLFGESPYPRKESANGIAFYDAAVERLWSDKGLSKSINRATSLRNILKAMLLAQGLIKPDLQGKITQPMIAAIDKSTLIDSIHELFSSLQQKGFLMMNATPVLHPQRKPQHEARFWLEFNNRLLQQMANTLPQKPQLVLWGKIAQQIEQYPIAQQFPHLICEHPYNISFITQPEMQTLFSELKLLDKY